MRILPAILVVLIPAVARAQPSAPTPPPTIPSGEARATVLHVPVATAPADHRVELTAVIDAAWAEPLLVARYRGPGATRWDEVAFRHSSTGGWYATIPASAVSAPGTEYYLVGRGPAGERIHFASEQAPHLVRVEPDESDRLAAIDHVRTEGRTDTVRFDVDAHDFGNRYGNDDKFLRSELVWTHRISRALYSIGFGFGAIQGKTPREDPSMDSVSHAARYGAAEVRLRLHRSVYADARMILGVSHAGFMRGVGGTVTFGKPWRANLAVSGELLDDLGPSVSVRLQWDTAPPMLMGASIVRTELPGVLISSSGLYLKYDVTYQLERGVSLRGALSYGSRDGAGDFGGGLGVATAF
ncbi:MAG: hypothetical protein IPL61_05985 [Myxococcales bacterium]|nr:hypothetical protein [Myxococcales bacterium]